LAKLTVLVYTEDIVVVYGRNTQTNRFNNKMSESEKPKESGQKRQKEEEQQVPPRAFPSDPNNMSKEDLEYFFYVDEATGLLKVKPEFRLPSTEKGEPCFHVKVSRYKKKPECAPRQLVFVEDF
jgi:hypothetical protein